MSKKVDNPELRTVELHDDGTNVIVSMEVSNPSSRTLHAYATPRKVQYDEATQSLKLYLSDRNPNPNLTGGMNVLPGFTSVDPSGKTTITVKLPRFLSQLVPGAVAGKAEWKRLPIHEAKNVEVEIAYNDTPFYADPRQKSGHVSEQLARWGKNVMNARGNRRELTER